jgi:hypothetical protein
MVTADFVSYEETIHDAQSRNACNHLKRMVNAHERPTDITAGCQPNTFQMLPRYHAENRVPTPQSKRRENLRIRR